MKLKPVYNKINIFTMLLFALLGISFSSSAQDVKATAQIDSNSIKIGQQTTIKLTVRYRADKNVYVKIKWPEIADTLRKEVEVVSQSRIDTVIPDKKDIYQFAETKTLYITSFDSGYWAIPPFKFIINGDTNGIFTDPLLLEVNTVPVDTTMAIKTIKPPYEETYTWMDWLKDNMYVIYAGIVAILTIIIIIFVVRYLRKVKPPMVIVEAPKIPAHILAFGKLEKLKNDKLWQEGKLKQYHSTLTDILREYIENRFKIPAQEQTTDEILYGFRNVAIDDESKLKLRQVLKLADLVKFAKEEPLAAENEASLTNSYSFIDGTKREEENTDSTKPLPDNTTAQ